MTTGARILDVARTQIGTVEDSSGSTPYHRAYGLPAGQPWCAVFLWWCFRQAGAGQLIHPKTAYTPTLAGWFRSRAALDLMPAAGDLVFFDWPDQLRRIQHVGLVEVVEPTAIVTIEGNTSTGNQGDGGRVMRRRRARGASIAGFGHPVYARPATRPQLRIGSTGPEVELLHRFLGVRRKGEPGYGLFDATTYDAVRRYQERQRLAVDGVVGPATWARIETALYPTQRGPNAHG